MWHLQLFHAVKMIQSDVDTSKRKLIILSCLLETCHHIFIFKVVFLKVKLDYCSAQFVALLAVELAPAEFQVPVSVAYYVFHDWFMRLTSEYILRTWSFWESFLKNRLFFPTADFQLETLYKHVVSLFKSAWVIFIEVLNIPVAIHIVILHREKHREKHLWIFSCCSSVWELLLCQAL